MTAAAKGLIKSANLPSGRANTTFTDPSHTARVFFEALVRLGYDKQALLAAAGADLSNSDDPDARVPCQALGGMLGYAMRTRPLTNLGMKMAAETPIGPAISVLTMRLIRWRSERTRIPSESSSIAFAILSLLNSGFLSSFSTYARRQKTG